MATGEAEPGEPDDRLSSVTFLDIGQGDCTLAVDRATASALVIDCPSKGVQEVLDILDSERLSLQVAMVTHWDLDHYGGIGRLARTLRPPRVFYNHDTLFTEERKHQLIKSTLKEFLDIGELGSTLYAYRAGDVIELGSMRLEVLAPTQAEVTSAFLRGRRNEASAVVALNLSDSRVLCGGDAVASTWTRLLRDQVDLTADILRWPHHGAELHGDRDGEVARDVLRRSGAKQVVISVGGRNSHSHPAESVISQSVEQGARVLCTEVSPACINGARSRAERLAYLANEDQGELACGSPCAGSISMEVGTSSYTLSPSPEEHNARIAEWPLPMCQKE